MGTFALNIIFKLLTSELAKTAIAIALNKLLEAKGDGITKEIAITMIDAIAKSKRNPTTSEVFDDARKLLVFD